MSQASIALLPAAMTGMQLMRAYLNNNRVEGGDSESQDQKNGATYYETNNKPSVNYELNYTIVKATMLPLVTTFFLIQCEGVSVLIKIATAVLFFIHLIVIGVIPLFIRSATKTSTEQ